MREESAEPYYALKPWRNRIRAPVPSKPEYDARVEQEVLQNVLQ